MKKNISDIGNACVGCRACEQACPVNCISVKANEEGFLYPIVDEELCIHCGKCTERCAQMEDRRSEKVPLEAYALKNKNKDDLFYSASGGAADAAAGVVIDRGGIVFGAAYTEEFRVEHIGITSNSERRKLQSSKYVQSDLKDCYSQAKEALERGRIVLFTGTPCQIDGLHCFLKKDYDSLYTADLICHGVPSPLFFEKYMDYVKARSGDKIFSYSFRSKEKKGWGEQVQIKTQNGSIRKRLSLDKYGKHFVAGDCYRECCYQCRYSNLNRTGDITVGDFWGIEKCHPEFASRAGVSSVLVNTEKGKRILNWMSEGVEMIPVSLEEVVLKQGNLKHATSRPDGRTLFYRGITQNDFIANIRVGIQIKERIKAVLPKTLIMKLKQIF